MSRAFALFLILPFLACGATYAAYRYKKANHDTLPRLSSMFSFSHSEEDEPDSPLTAMQDAELELWKRHATMRLNPQAITNEAKNRTKDLVEFIVSQWEKTEAADGDFTDTEKVEARLLAVRAEFIGAKTWPGEFGESFLATAEETVMMWPGTEAAAQVESLRFLHEHTMDSGLDRDFVDDIDRFASAYPNSPMVPTLYVTASEEFMRNGHEHSAGLLLRRGLLACQGGPGVNQMVNALVDQGHAPPPAPLITDKKLAARMRAAGNKKKQLNRRPHSSLPAFYGGFKPSGMLPGAG